MKTSEKGFICCPKCGRPTKTKVLPQTRLTQFPLWCPWCKGEHIIDHNKKAGA